MAALDATAGMRPVHVFGAGLRYYRTRAGLSQEQVGERLHFSGDLIGKIENGQRTPTEQPRLSRPRRCRWTGRSSRASQHAADDG
jgi:predicted transcriptional regulator